MAPTTAPPIPVAHAMRVGGMVVGDEPGGPAAGDRGPLLAPVRDRGGRVRGLRPVLVEDADVGLLVESLAAVVADGAALASMGAAGLKDRVSQLRRLSGLAEAGLARTVAALDRAGGVASDGAPSKAEWLKANTGRSGRDAARMQRLADNLDELPATADALASGDLTSEAADAIVHASRDGRLGGPGEVDADLVRVATSGSPEQLRRHIRRRQQQADGAALLRQEQRQHARRDLKMNQASTGEWDVHSKLPGEVGTKFRTALDAFDVPDPPGAVKRRPGARLVDALESMLDTVLDNGMTPGTGGVARPHLSVLVDLATIDADLRRRHGLDDLDDLRAAADGRDAGAAAGAGADGTVAVGADRSRRSDSADGAVGSVAVDDPVWADLPPGTTAWDGLVSPQAIRRLLCDASVTRIVTNGDSQILDVGRATREWSEPQRRAVNARDRGCRGPNCYSPIAWTHIHHIRWWDRDRGPTNLDNGIAVCHHCHHLVHDHGWSVTLDPRTARATWTSPTGTVVTNLPGDTSVGSRGSPGPGSGQPHSPPLPDADPAILPGFWTAAPPRDAVSSTLP